MNHKDNELEEFCRYLEGSRASAEIAPIEPGAENITVVVSLSGAETEWPMLCANMIRRASEERNTSPEKELRDIIAALEDLVLDREIDMKKLERSVHRFRRKKAVPRQFRQMMGELQ